MSPHHVPVYKEGKRKVFNKACVLGKDIQVGNNYVQIFLAQSNGQGVVMAIAKKYRRNVILKHKLIEPDAIIDKLFFW